MKLAPSVSVIIPTFNRCRLLEKAITSVLAQTLKDLEIIVIDDASSDGTQTVVQNINDPRVRYIRQTRNSGPAAARNIGIEQSRGHYIAFLDDDDVWLSQKLERQLKELVTYDALLCAAISSSGRKRESCRSGPITESVLRRGNIFPPSGLIARATVFRTLKFDTTLPNSVGEDWDLYIRLAGSFRLGFLDEPLFIYNDNTDAPRITSEQAFLSIDALERRVQVVLKHRDFFGPFWARYHIASTLLSYIAQRKGKWKQIYYAIQRAGLVPVSAVFARRIIRRI